MGKLHDLSRYGRCAHGVIARPGACPKCAREKRASVEAWLRSAGVRPGARYIACGPAGTVVGKLPDGRAQPDEHDTEA